MSESSSFGGGLAGAARAWARRWVRLWVLLSAACTFAPAGARAQQANGDSGTGTLRVLVFYGEAPVPGARIKVGDKSATANEHGSAEIDLPPGTYDLHVRFASVSGGPDLRGEQRVGVVAGETNEVIAFVSEAGKPMVFELEGPSVEEAETRAEAKAIDEFGTIEGRITSIEDSSPVPDARLFVRGVDAEAISDANGRYEIRVPIGNHALSVIQPQFSTITRPNIEVRKDETTEVDLVLTPVSVRLEDFVVTAPHIEGSVAGLLDERRQSSAVSDAIGREDISKMPASDAAQAAQRVVGATVVGGKFIYVRGLGERYTNALLNGAPLPSPEPDRATVPLDLFPAQILESLDVAKTFTPDMPGDFAGGSVRIVTRGVPDGLVYNVSLSGSYNTQSTFRNAYTAPSGKYDWLGFDDGGRALSPEIPTDYSLERGEKPGGMEVTPDTLRELAEPLNSRMSPNRERLPPGVSGSLLLGKGWKLRKGRRFGVLGSLVYSRKFEAYSGIRGQFEPSMDDEDVGGLDPWRDYEIDFSRDSVRWGAFLTSILELSDNHTIRLHGMHSQLADNVALLGLGRQGNEDALYQVARLEYVSRGLTNGQVQGEHKVSAMNDALFEWKAFLSSASLDQPDTRDLAYQRSVSQPDSPWVFVDTTPSARHFFADQSELTRGGAFDWTQPLWGGTWATKIKLGTMISAKKRDFRSRRLRLATTREGTRSPERECEQQYDPIACPDALFVEENMGTIFEVHDGYQEGDAYDAILNVYAAYGMTEIQLGERWRAMGGVRLEQTQQELLAVDPFESEVLEDKSAHLSSLDILPAGSLVYSPLEEFSIRAAASKTLARPQLRELAPFFFSDFFGGLPVAGNPDLELTSILNADLRFEWFPSPSEVFAVSAFAKKFDKPIEPVFRPTSGTPQLGFENAAGARLFGVELEGRKRLDFIADALEDFTFIGSLMWADSEIQISDEEDDDSFLTNLNRPLVFQAPYVIQLAMDYENEYGTQARILYNTAGPQIAQVGRDGLDDAYLQPQHSLDATFSQAIGERWRIKLNAKNILNTWVLVTQGKKPKDYNILTKYRKGASISLGVSYSN